MTTFREYEGIQCADEPGEALAVQELVMGAIHVAKAVMGLALDQEAYGLVQNKLGMAAQASLLTVNALISATGAKCNLSNPPEDIEMKVNAGGRLVLRCYHSPAHEWDLTGNPLP